MSQGKPERYIDPRKLIDALNRLQQMLNAEAKVAQLRAKKLKPPGNRP
jgi:hypothetical protein